MNKDNSTARKLAVLGLTIELSQVIAVHVASFNNNFEFPETMSILDEVLKTLIERKEQSEAYAYKKGRSLTKLNKELKTIKELEKESDGNL